MFKKLLGIALALGITTVAIASVTVNINGTNYTIPQTGERGWGTQVTSWIQAASSSLLQKNGGSFTLNTADVDFGNAFGLKSIYYKSRATNLPTAGVLRLGNTEAIDWRNAANSGDLGLSVNGTDQLTYNGNVLIGTGALGASSVVLTDSSGGLITTSTLARNKVATGTASHVVINDGSGNLSSEASLAISRGGTGQATAASGFDALAPTTTNGDLIARSGGTNARLAIGSSGQVLKVVGSTPTWSSFSGGVNYISANPDAEGNTTSGWATYADAAGTSPVDGTGGSPTTTFTASSSSPLRGSYNFLLTKDAANRQGEGASYAFTIDRADLAKPLMVSFDYEAGGSFVGGDSSDVRVYLYDVTNSQIIQPAPYTLQCNVSVQCKFISYFQTASSSTSYRLIYHVATTNASAWTLKIDNVYVGPDKQTYGTPSSDWVAYTPTGAWSSSVTYTGTWRRVGDSMEVHAVVAASGNTTAATFTLNLPSGYTIDTTKLAGSTANNNSIPGGAGELFDTSASDRYPLVPVYSTTTAVSLIFANTGLLSNTSPVTIASGDKVSLSFTVPISGWSSNVLMSNDTDTRVNAANYNGTPTGTLTNSFNTATFPSQVSDTNAAYSSGSYTIPVSGSWDISSGVDVSGTFAAAALVGIAVFVDGVQNATNYSFAGSVSNTELNPIVTAFNIPLSAGQVVTIRVKTTATGPAYVANTGANFFTISRRSGPSTVAASEAITVSAGEPNAVSLTNNTNITIPFATHTIDDHGVFSSGVFTAPSPGKYLVAVALMLTTGGGWNAAEQFDVEIQKNNTAVSRFFSFAQAAHSTYMNVGGSQIVPLVSGDTIRIQALQNSGGAITLEPDARFNVLSISKVGN